MHLLAPGTPLPPGLPARTGDAPTDGEKPDETAIFEAFLGLALSVPSPDGAITTGPEGKSGSAAGFAGLFAGSGNPATQGGKTLPGGLPGSDDSLADADPLVPGKQLTTGIAVPNGLQVQLEPSPLATTTGLVIRLPIADHASPPQSSLHALSVSLGLRVDGLGHQSFPVQPTSAQAALPGFIAASATAPAAISAAPALATIQLLGSPLRELPATGSGASGEATDAPDTAAHALTARPPAPAGNAEPQADTSAQDQPAARPARDPAAQPRGESVKPETVPEPAPRMAKTAIAEATPTGSAAPSQNNTALSAAPLSQTSPVEINGQPRRGEATTSGQDFADIVDRLVRAREANVGEVVRTTVTTRDFGPVAMQMRTAEGRLHVAMTSIDPGFAPAVQAASAAGSANQQQANTDGSAPQQHSQSSHGFAQGQAAADGQGRQQQQAERTAQAHRQQGSDQHPADEPTSQNASRGKAGGAIYA